MATTLKEALQKKKKGYYMDTGGGQPIPAGHKMTTEKRDDQPRDPKTHQFESNAIAGLPTKYPSRGKGESPYEDVKIRFAKSSGKPSLEIGDDLLEFPKGFTPESFIKAITTWNPKTKEFGVGIDLNMKLKKKGGKWPKDVKKFSDILGEKISIWQKYYEKSSPNYANHAKYDASEKEASKDYHFQDSSYTWKKRISNAVDFLKQREDMDLEFDKSKSADQIIDDNKFAVDYVLGTANMGLEEGEKKWTRNDIKNIIESGAVKSFMDINQTLVKWKFKKGIAA